MCESTVFPSLKNCCFCVPLRASTIVIAIIYTCLSVVQLFVYAMPLALHTPMEVATGYFYYIATLALIAQFVFGCVLIYAAIEKKHWLFCFWLWLSFGQSAVLVVLAMVCSGIYIYQVTNGFIDGDLEEAITYAVHMIYGVVLYYAASVVESYRKQLSNTERAAEDGQAENLPLGAV